MPKKYLNAILILLLLCIWGAVFWKHFIKPKTEVAAMSVISPVAYNTKFSIPKDTFDLEITNNPFKTATLKRPVVSARKSNAVKKKVKPVNKVWPSIQYYGFVKRSQNTTRLALIKVSNKLYRKREQESFNDLKLLKAYNDSIIITFNGDKKTIYRVDD